ncbi:MAG: MurR/RpiR family transcriptional regulator [Bacillota bacterium]|nr:hypothetical protein [Bacillota bacterium]
MEPEPIPTPAPPDGDKRDLLRRLTSFRQSRASRTEQILCDYLIAAYRDAAFLTAEELARAAGVSKATVIRLATKIGFASFNDLRERLRRIVADDLHRADREEQGPDALQPAQRLIALEGENVRRLARQLRWEDVEQAAHWLCGSRSVTVLGLGRCAALAVHAGYHLKRLLPHVYIYTAADASLWDHLTLAQDGGVVLAIGLRPCDRRLVEAVAYARSLGYPILAVVEEYGSPLSEAATVELPAPAATDAFTGAYAAPITLLTALVHAVAATLGETALTRLRTLAEAGDALKLYC